MNGGTSLLGWSLRQSWRGVTASGLSGLGYQAGLIALPWCLGRALDDGITARDNRALILWALAVLAVSASMTVVELGMRWWATLAGIRTGNVLLHRLARRILGWDSATVNRFGHGDLVVRGTRDIEMISAWLSTVPSLLSGVIGFATVIAIVSTLDPLLAVVGLSTVPLLVLVNLWYPRQYERANASLSAAHGARANAVEDLLSASTAVRGLGGETVLVQRHHERSAAVLDRTLALARVAANWAAHAPFIPWLATGVGLAAGGLAVLDGRFSIGGLVAFASWMALLGRQVMMLTFRFNQLGDAYTAAGRISTVLAAEAALTESGEPVSLPPNGELATTGLRVELDGREPLELADLRIAPGEFVAITGATGSGKSTLLRLLARLADPASGAVTFGGVDVRAASIAELRDRITIVSQRPLLISGTIGENLRLGRTGIGLQQLRAATRDAAIDGHIEGLPDGFDTVVGERGSTLSGGQVQRVALARGLLRGASVLLLDDVTSAVDAGTEARILDRLRELDVTIVFATSRPAVAARADRVIHLAGSVLPDELLMGGARG